LPIKAIFSSKFKDIAVWGGSEGSKFSILIVNAG